MTDSGNSYVTIKPKRIEAIQWTGDNADECTAFVSRGDRLYRFISGGYTRLYVEATHAWVEIEVGEWIAKDSLGCYPIKDAIFRETYRKEEPEPEEPAQPLAEDWQIERHAEKQGVSWNDAWRYFEVQGYDMTDATPQD